MFYLYEIVSVEDPVPFARFITERHALMFVRSLYPSCDIDDDWKAFPWCTEWFITTPLAAKHVRVQDNNNNDEDDEDRGFLIVRRERNVPSDGHTDLNLPNWEVRSCHKCGKLYVVPCPERGATGRRCMDCVDVVYDKSGRAIGHQW